MLAFSQSYHKDWLWCEMLSSGLEDTSPELALLPLFAETLGVWAARVPHVERMFGL